MAHQRFLSALPNSMPLATAVRGRSLQSTIAGTFRRFALAVSLLALSAAVPGFAATDTVTSLADDGSAGTLRSVVAAAASGDTIAFSVSGTITLTLGELYLRQNLTISGPGAASLAISGNNASGVLEVGPGTVSISGVTIENGIPGYYYDYGGGIANFGTLTLTNSTVSGNGAYYGGGIYNQGTLTLTNSTVSSNQGGIGAGIYSYGTLTLTNSTISGNDTWIGGGIANYGTLTLTNSTVSGNSAAGYGGILNYGPLTAKNSIVANNSGGNCYSSQPITSQGYNLSDDGSCSFGGTGDQNNSPAGLDPSGLQNNGGPTQTIALLPGSTAVDAIPLSACSDASGNLVTTDQRGIARPQGFACDIGAFELTQVPTANVCPAGQTTPAPCSYTITLQYNIPPGTTFGASPVKVVTQGAPNLDFTLANTTCTGSPANCIINVTFAPLAPGARMGAVQLFDNSNNLLATTMVHGTGKGPAIGFGPGVQTTVPTSGLGMPYGEIAVDGAGDVFIVDHYNSRVVEVPAGGGPQTTIPATGLNYPTAVAVDGAGDVFITDTGNSRVVEVPAGGGPQTTVGSGLSLPQGLAVDGAGDVFIGDSYNSRVVEVPAGGGPQVTVPAIGLLYPAGVAVDGAGDVFIADNNNSRVVEVPAGGGPQITVGSGLYYPYAVAVDAAGDVFIADTDNSRIVEVPAGGGAQFTVGIGLNLPYGVAVDGAGDVFIADTYNYRVVEVQRSQPPTLSFASTADGNTSSDSPQSVTIQNVGNQLLNALAPGLLIGPNFLQVAGSGTPEDCTGSFALTPGASCNLSLSFEPQSAGNLSTTATFTDNALNASPSAVQSIALQGTGIGVTTVVWSNPAPITYGTPLGATQLNASATPFRAGTYAYNPPANTVLNAGSQTLSVTFTPSNVGYASSMGSVTLYVNQASQTITFTQAAPATAAYNSSFTVAASASSGLPVAFTASGSCSNVGATYTITSGAGTCSVIASQGGNSNYSAASPVTQSTAATRSNATVTFTGAPSTAPYLSTFTLAATTSSTAVAYITATDPSTCSLSRPYSPVLVTMLKDFGSCTFTASWGADANYNPATSTQSTTAAKATPVITWATPAAITYGTPLGAAQLNATANVLGTFSYTPKSGSIENVGTDTLNVTFTPTSANYKSATATVALQVTQAATATTITSPSSTATLNSVGIATAVLAYNVTSYKPTGAVTLTASTGEVCTGTINAANGNGSCKLTFNNTGTRSITASYDGDRDHAGSNSSGQTPAITVTVKAK